jgi:drug/metabolite transporter (DMT)-like permease
MLFKAYSLLPAQLAQPLSYTWPIAFTIVSIPLLRQRLDARGVAAILVALAGMYVIVTQGRLGTLEVESPLGVGLVLGSAVILAAYWIMSMSDRRDVMGRLFVSFCFGSIYVLIVAALTGRLQVPSMRGVVGSAYVGLFEMGLALVLWFRALGLSRTIVQVSILIYIVPFLSLVPIHLVLGEPIAPSTIIGLVLIVTGIMIKQYRDVARALKRR